MNERTNEYLNIDAIMANCLHFTWNKSENYNEFEEEEEEEDAASEGRTKFAVFIFNLNKFIFNLDKAFQMYFFANASIHWKNKIRKNVVAWIYK